MNNSYLKDNDVNIKIMKNNNTDINIIMDNNDFHNIHDINYKNKHIYMNENMSNDIPLKNKDTNNNNIHNKYMNYDTNQKMNNCINKNINNGNGKFSGSDLFLLDQRSIVDIRPQVARSFIRTDKAKPIPFQLTSTSPPSIEVAATVDLFSLLHEELQATNSIQILHTSSDELKSSPKEESNEPLTAILSYKNASPINFHKTTNFSTDIETSATFHHERLTRDSSNETPFSCSPIWKMEDVISIDFYEKETPLPQNKRSSDITHTKATVFSSSLETSLYERDLKTKIPSYIMHENSSFPFQIGANSEVAAHRSSRPLLDWLMEDLMLPNSVHERTPTSRSPENTSDITHETTVYSLSSEPTLNELTPEAKTSPSSTAPHDEKFNISHQDATVFNSSTEIPLCLPLETSPLRLEENFLPNGSHNETSPFHHNENSCVKTHFQELVFSSYHESQFRTPSKQEKQLHIRAYCKAPTSLHKSNSIITHYEPPVPRSPIKMPLRLTSKISPIRLNKEPFHEKITSFSQYESTFASSLNEKISASSLKTVTDNSPHKKSFHKTYHEITSPTSQKTTTHNITKEKKSPNHIVESPISFDKIDSPTSFVLSKNNPSPSSTQCNANTNFIPSDDNIHLISIDDTTYSVLKNDIVYSISKSEIHSYLESGSPTRPFYFNEIAPADSKQ